jgi:hypothetical protein
MDDLRASLLSFAVIFVVTQLTAFPIAGPDSLARMELNKYLKAQRE